MREYDLVGVLDGMHAVAPLPDLQMVAYGGLTAVLAAMPRPAIRLPQSRKQTLTEAAARLGWQEACMTLGTVLPARSDNPLTHDGAITFLIANKPLLSRLMERFGGLVQVQVTVGWQESGVLNRFRHSEELAPLFTQAKATPKSLAHAITLLSQRLSHDIEQRLAAVSVEIAPLPVTASMLWNGSLLVGQTGIEALSSTVEAIDAIWTEGFCIRQIGPAPAGSFVTLALERISGRQVEAALAAFGMKSALEAGRFAARRRERLLSAADNLAMREEIRAQSRIVEAAVQLPCARRGFSLASIWAEGKSGDLLQRREVA